MKSAFRRHSWEFWGNVCGRADVSSLIKVSDTEVTECVMNSI